MADLQNEIKKRKPFEYPAEEGYLNVMRTQSVLLAECEAVLKRYGLSEPKYNALRILRGATQHGEFGGQGVPCLEIGHRMVARVPDVTRLVDRLEADGLVARHRTAEDRRVVLVAITDKGLSLLAEIDGPLRAMNEQWSHLMSAAEWRELSRLLVKARQIHAADST